jgi:hypothetical protein
VVPVGVDEVSPPVGDVVVVSLPVDDADEASLPAGEEQENTHNTAILLKIAMIFLNFLLPAKY